MLEAKLLAGRSGYDVVVPTASPFLARQITAGVYLPIDKAEAARITAISIPQIMAAAGQRTIPATQYAVP